MNPPFVCVEVIERMTTHPPLTFFILIMANGVVLPSLPSILSDIEAFKIHVSSGYYRSDILPIPTDMKPLV